MQQVVSLVYLSSLRITLPTLRLKRQALMVYFAQGHLANEKQSQDTVTVLCSSPFQESLASVLSEDLRGLKTMVNW